MAYLLSHRITINIDMLQRVIGRLKIEEKQTQLGSSESYFYKGAIEGLELLSTVDAPQDDEQFAYAIEYALQHEVI